jgi:hypothetical protein
MSRDSEPSTKNRASDPRPIGRNRESSVANLKRAVVCAARSTAVREGVAVLLSRSEPVLSARSCCSRLTKTAPAGGRGRSGGALTVLDLAKITEPESFTSASSAA